MATTEERLTALETAMSKAQTDILDRLKITQSSQIELQRDNEILNLQNQDQTTITDIENINIKLVALSQSVNSLLLNQNNLFQFTFAGQAMLVTNFMGARYVPQDMVISNIVVMLDNSGTSGTTTVDLNAGTAASQSTLFTTQSNRPSKVADGQSAVITAVPDIVAITSGQILTVDIDQLATGVAGISVQVNCTPT